MKHIYDNQVVLYKLKSHLS